MCVCAEMKKKTQSLQKMILFVEIFANVKRFGFKTFIGTCKSFNERKILATLITLQFLQIHLLKPNLL